MEITAQTALLTERLKGADLHAPVPSCPGWNLGQLLRHLGAGHRWAATIVRTRATVPPPDTELRQLPEESDLDSDGTAEWLAEGATLLADALREAGPESELWTPVTGVRSVRFWARRFAHETLVHRADAAIALGADFPVEPDVAVDALDEWMELGSLPQMLDIFPERRKLLGPGRTLHFHATDTAPEAGAEWVVDLTDELLAWRRSHEKAAVAVRGPLSELLLVIYRRRPIQAAEVDVIGDRTLLDSWLAQVSFG